MARKAGLERRAMDTGMLWISEGYMQDDAGNLVLTPYLLRRCFRLHAPASSYTYLDAPNDAVRSSRKRTPAAPWK